MNIQREILEIMGKSPKEHPFDASFFTAPLGISRNAASHHLNRMAEAGLVTKSHGRPVLFSLRQGQPSQNNDVFSAIVGRNGSLGQAVEQCSAAMAYPPNGLPMVLLGEAGVGKSMLAHCLYLYCLQTKQISENAPYVVLNCADYAHNTELLSSVLFGYKKGSFTGAEEDRPGLLEQANSGVLFLDEVHRLSPAAQEKLFLFMDQHQFSRLGETGITRTAAVRLIFATTEPLESALILTLRRRIPLTVTLPPYAARPLPERLGLIRQFFALEARKLNKPILVKAPAVNQLLASPRSGNVGELRNQVQLLCAFSNKTSTAGRLLINPPANSFSAMHSLIDEDLLLLPDDVNAAHSSTENITPTTFLSADFEALCREVQRLPLADSSLPEGDIVQMIEQLLMQQLYSFGLGFSAETVCQLAFCSQAVCAGSRLGFTVSHAERLRHGKAFTLAHKAAKAMAEALCTEALLLETLYAAIFSIYIPNNFRLRGLLLAHGESMATSIAGVVNTLCDEYIFDFIDMPMDTTSAQLVSHVQHSVARMDTRDGLVILVDMGSLAELYQPIKSSLDGDLLIINLLSTPIALDIALKIKQGMQIQQIIEASRHSFKVEFKYYEGLSKNKNIVVSCISGIGIAQKIKLALQPYFATKSIDVIAMDYEELEQMLKTSPSAFRHTLCVITTNEVQTSAVPILEMQAIIEHSGCPKELKDIFSTEDYHYIEGEIISFFTVEGIARQLTVLNPDIIHQEVTEIILQYEQWYQLEFENYLWANLLMHLSVMVERILLGQPSSKATQTQLSQAQKKFIAFSKTLYASIERRYRIDIPLAELLLLMEIIEHGLRRGTKEVAEPSDEMTEFN